MDIEPDNPRMSPFNHRCYECKTTEDLRFVRLAGNSFLLCTSCLRSFKTLIEKKVINNDY